MSKTQSKDVVISFTFNIYLSQVLIRTTYHSWKSMQALILLFNNTAMYLIRRKFQNSTVSLWHLLLFSNRNICTELSCNACIFPCMSMDFALSLFTSFIYSCYVSKIKIGELGVSMAWKGRSHWISRRNVDITFLWRLEMWFALKERGRSSCILKWRCMVYYGVLLNLFKHLTSFELNK